MFVVRWLLGRIILLVDFIFTPRSPKRTTEEQAEIDNRTSHISLYQLAACPFCVKVRRAMKRDGIKLDIRNIKSQPDYREELLAGGGKAKVPCLRIEEQNGDVKWMYESNDIIAYLKTQIA